MYAHQKSISLFSLLLMMAVLVSFGIVACSKKDSESSYDHFIQAQKYYQEGRYQTAIVELKNALQKDPKNGEARYLFAVIHNDMGQGAEAEIELGKALQLGVDKSKVDVALGKALLLQQKYQKVLDEIKVSDRMEGEQAAAIFTIRGDALFGLDKVAEAKAAFNKAVEKDHDYSGAYLGLASLAASKNDLKEAIDQTDIALSKSPKNSQAWLMKASILRMQGESDKARSAYEHIIQIDKRNVTSHLALASMDVAAGKLDAARAEIAAADKITPKNLQVRYMQAVLHFGEGNYIQARDALQDVMKSIPDYMPGILLSGAVSYALGSYEQAHQYLSQFLGQVPDDIYATNLLIATDLHLNQPDEAIKHLGPLLAKSPEDPQVLALAGEAYMQTKEYAKATEYLAKASAIEPRNASLRTQLGASRLGSGEIQQAIQDLESAVAMDSGQSKADALLVVTYLNKGEYDKVLDTAQAWEKKQPKNPIVYYLEGEAYVAKKDISNARKQFEKSVKVKSDYLPAVVYLAQLDLIEQNPKAAKQRLEDFLEVDKNNVRVMYALARVALMQKQGKEYVKWLEKAAEVQPDSIVPRIKLVEYYLANKDKAKALSIAHATLKRAPDNPGALNLLGATQLAAGDADSALGTYTKLVEKAPNMPDVYLRLALAQLAVKKSSDARDSLKRALEVKPDFLQAQDMLIRLDMGEKKSDDALAIARKIQQQRPKSPAGYEREAAILMVKKQYAEAAKSYDQALSSGAGSDEFINLHGALIAAGDKITAEKRLTSWLQLHPADLLVRGYAADYYMANNRNLDAIAQYQAYVKAAPQQKAIVPLNNLAILYQSEGDSHKALVAAEQAIKLAPDNPSIKDTLGWILVQQGQLHRALDILRDAASKAPNAGIIHYHFAVALARSGRKQEAKMELEAAIGSGRKFPELNDAKKMLKNL